MRAGPSLRCYLVWRRMPRRLSRGWMNKALFLVHLRVDGDLHIVTDDHRGIFAANVEICTLNGNRRFDPGYETSLQALLGRGGRGRIKDDRARYAGYRKGACNLQATTRWGHGGGLEDDGLELVGVEECVRLEIFIAVAVSRIDRCHVESCVYAVVCRICRIPDNGSGNASNRPAHVAHGHVADFKMRFAVSWIDRPGAGLGNCRSCQQGKSGEK